MRDFQVWLTQFRNSISGYDYYVDFPKVLANARSKKAELHLLNALVGSQNIEVEFRDLVTRYPTVVNAIPILLAVRSYEIYAADGETGGLYRFCSDGRNSLDDYVVFMRKTGLFDLISRHIINNLYDYVIGVEVGLDSNGRKNRGGHQMEDLVESFLVNANVLYEKEMRASVIMSRYGIDVASLTNTGKAEKRFDFVVPAEKCFYAIETNFYASGGSKLNETARSYKMLALEARQIPKFKFVWFTDGQGWFSARNNLRETFEVLPTLYNIKELEDGVMSTLFV